MNSKIRQVAKQLNAGVQVLPGKLQTVNIFEEEITTLIQLMNQLQLLFLER